MLQNLIRFLKVTGFVVTASQIKVSVITTMICIIAGSLMCANVKPVQDY